MNDTKPDQERDDKTHRAVAIRVRRRRRKRHGREEGGQRDDGRLRENRGRNNFTL